MPVDRAARAHKREQVRQRLMDAADALLEEHPWPEVTVELITSRGGVSRTVFYQHFRDRQELLLTLFDAVAADLAHVGDGWMKGGEDPAAEHRRSLVGLTGLFERHGRLLQAVNDAAVLDADVAAAYGRLVDVIVDTTTEAIVRDVAHGAMQVVDAEQMSRALSAMMERYLLRSFGRAPFPDPAVVAETLATVWIRTLYTPGG